MYDSIVNPFGIATDEKEFLTVEEWDFMKLPGEKGEHKLIFAFLIDSSKNQS